MSQAVDSITNEHVLEIRFKPNPKVLDHRGTWAEEISRHMELTEWRIVENRIDVFSKTEDVHAFVGFRNAGFAASDTPTANFFPDKAVKLLRYVFRLDGFGDPLAVERLGVRSRFCTAFDGSFETLCERYATRFLTLTEDARKAIGDKCRLIDIGGPLNFADNLGNFNTMSGPMARAQLAAFFRKDEGFPEVGLFVDMDYWRRPDKDLPGAEVLSLVKTFAEAAWTKHDRIRDLILGA